MPAERPSRDAYRRFTPMTTRLRDNDMYGHMNNAVFYEYFDAAVNLWLSEAVGLVLPFGPVVGIVADTQCTFFAEVKWPQKVEVGMRAERLGNSSLTYGLAVFAEDETLANAACRYVHVYVDGASRKPLPLPAELRAAAESIAAG